MASAVIVELLPTSTVHGLQRALTVGGRFCATGAGGGGGGGGGAGATYTRTPGWIADADLAAQVVG